MIQQQMYLLIMKMEKKSWDDFKVRVVEHNMRIMAKYYTRVRTQKMADLLDLTKDEAEQFLSNLVSNKTIIAKIDRLQDIVTFQQKKNHHKKFLMNGRLILIH